MLGYVAIVQLYLFFHSRQGEDCKDKIVPAKLREVHLRAVLVAFGSLENP